LDFYKKLLANSHQNPSPPLPPLLLVTMGDMANEIKLLSGNSHPILAKLIADRYVFALLIAD
jgi:hypothetical protein